MSPSCVVDINISKAVLEAPPYDYAPFDEHLMKVVERRELNSTMASRLVRWLMSSKHIE